MGYLNLIWKRAFGPTWTIFVVITVLAPWIADAIWGENQPVQYIAWAIFGVALLIVAFRLLIAPYQIWAEDQAKIEALETPGEDPLKSRKKRLSDASSGLLTSAKAIYNEWSVSDERRRGYLQSDYNDKRKRATSLADGFLHQEDVYRAAQDAMNRCDILIDDAREGLPNRDNFTEAHEYTRTLITLLAPTTAINSGC